MAGKFGNLPGAGPGRPKGIKNGQGKAAVAKNKREAKKTEKEMNALFKDAINLTFQMISPSIYKYLARLYVSAIDFFYASYTPINYQRTYQTQFRNFDIENGGKQGGGQGPVRKFFSNTKEGIVTGIDVSSEYYTDPHPYKDPTDYVFKRTIEEGIHGITSYKKKDPDGSVRIVDIKPMTPTPDEYIKSYIKMYTTGEGEPFQRRYKDYVINNLFKKFLPEALKKLAKSNKYKVR